MKYNRKKEIMKNIIYTFLILLLAIFSTYHIYYKFQGDRSIDFNSESLDVTYHEKSGDQITIKKVTPVTDSVGLSSKAYLISIKNNLTEQVNYKIKILDDLEKIVEDECEENQIPKESIRISVKVNKKENKIYDLEELEDNILLEDTIDALKTNNIAIRVWVKQDSGLPMGTNMHYHGIMQVIEEDNYIAINN